jgi:hypothetical protein
MDRGQMFTEMSLMARKAGPAVVGSAGSAGLASTPDVAILGMTTGHWAIIASMATIAYIAFQAFFLIRDKWWRDPERRKRKSK